MRLLKILANFVCMNSGYEFRVPKPRFSSIGHVIAEARDSYCWIFNRESLRWWTPDEFYDEFHEKDQNSVKMLNFLTQISIRDPRTGITAAFKQLSDMEIKHSDEKKVLINRIEEFNKKVITYYQTMAKPKLRKQN